MSAWGGGGGVCLTAPFTKPPARRSPSWNNPQGPFQPPAPFTAYGSFRNCTRQNYGMAGNREVDSFVNSTVRGISARGAVCLGGCLP